MNRHPRTGDASDSVRNVRLDRIYTRGGDAGRDEPRRRPARLEGRAAHRGLRHRATSSARPSGWRSRRPAAGVWTTWLGRIQNDLFDLGADLCVPLEERETPGDARAHRLRVTPSRSPGSSARCDELSETLEPLTSSCSRAARRPRRRSHLARTICRRAERHAVALAESEPVGPGRARSTSTGSPTCSSSLARSQPTGPRRGALASGRIGGRAVSSAGHARAGAARGAGARRSRASPSSRSTRPATPPLDYDRDLGDPGQLPVHARALRDDAPRPAVDDAHVRRVRHRRRDQRALPLPARRRARPGLSTAFDMPTLMGYDSDHAALARRGRARGRRDRHAGRHGGPVRGHPARPGHHVDDRQRAGRDGARDVRLHGASARASRSEALGGTIQTDILKEFIAQKEWIFPPEPSMRLVVDMIEWCTHEHAALASGLDQRATTSARRARPPPRSSRSRSPTASPTSRPASSAGMDGRRLRAAAVVLLQRPPRLLRGDRQVPRGAPHLGARAARPLRRARRSARC